MSIPHARRVAGALAVLAAATALVVTPASPAQALAYASDTAWTSGPANTWYCNRTGASIGSFGDEPDSPNHPSSATVTNWAFQGQLTGGALSCRTGISNGVERWLAVRLDLYKWADGHWLICRQRGWQYAYGRSHSLSLQFPYLEPPCGEGHYATMGFGYRFDDGVWRGGAVWSGYIYLSHRGRSAPAESAPPRPAWVDADSTVDLSRMPTVVETLDEHGPTGRHVMPLRHLRDLHPGPGAGPTR